MILEMQGGMRVVLFVMAVENRVIAFVNVDELESDSIIVEIQIIVRIK
jgi:hypothetical protein